MSFRRQGIFLARGKERATYLLPRFSLAGEMNACHLLRALTPSCLLYIYIPHRRCGVALKLRSKFQTRILPFYALVHFQRLPFKSGDQAYIFKRSKY